MKLFLKCDSRWAELISLIPNKAGVYRVHFLREDRKGWVDEATARTATFMDENAVQAKIADEASAEISFITCNESMLDGLSFNEITRVLDRCLNVERNKLERLMSACRQYRHFAPTRRY